MSEWSESRSHARRTSGPSPASGPRWPPRYWGDIIADRVRAFVSSPFEPLPSEPSARLEDRVLATLLGLPGRWAFSGLRRVLRAHPESLARALRRLEREGLVERVDGSYRALRSRPQTKLPQEPALRAIARVSVARSLDPAAALGRLSGRWFGSLRWVGAIERPGGRLLAWALRDGAGYVLLGLERGELTVYVPAAIGPLDPSELEEGAYELLIHALEAVRMTPDLGPTALLSPDSHSPPGWIVEN